MVPHPCTVLVAQVNWLSVSEKTPGFVEPYRRNNPGYGKILLFCINKITLRLDISDNLMKNLTKTSDNKYSIIKKHTAIMKSDVFVCDDRLKS